MGIGGSAISAVALLAKEIGFKVSGCNLEGETAYLSKVKNSIKNVKVGHDVTHLAEVDLLVVTPSVFYQSSTHPELVEAKRLRKLMTWQKFLGSYLHKGKKVICVTGTHGKSTTSTIVGLLFEKAGFDPSVVIGAKVKEWEANFRYGKGDFFITEADEFYDNFLNYQPEAIILNNVEFDHPDYFSSETDVVESFSKFVKKLKDRKILIVNQDSHGIERVFKKLGPKFLKRLNIYGYSLKTSPNLMVKNSVAIEISKKDEKGTVFSLSSKKLGLNYTYHLKIPGEYNVANATGAIILANLYGINMQVIQKVLSSFHGVGRRLELVGEKRGVKIYDDYAHHPTAINVTLSALRQKYPKERVWAIVEPHSYSRTKTLLKEYKGVFEAADKVIIGPIFKARDTKEFGVSSYSIVKVSSHKDIKFIPTIPQIVNHLKKEAKTKDIILVMGAGESYKWAREILKNL